MERLDPVTSYQDPLSPWAKRGLLAAVVFFHVGAGYALTQIEPSRIIAGEASPMEVSFVAPDQPPLPETPQEIPPEPPQLESMVLPPEPDVPPPVFPVPPPPPPKPAVKPPPPKQATPTPPTPAPPAAAPSQITGPRTVTESQVAYIDRPNVIYPAKSRRRGDQGKTMLRVLIDTSGRPAQVLIDKSSGHETLDDAAVSGVRAARFKPYIEHGIAQPVWVIVPINFVLQQ